LGSGDLREVASLLHNDLELAAFKLRPALEAKKQALLGAGALGAVMSGSGPTMFGIALDEGHARAMAANVSQEFDCVRVCKSRAECIERLD
jgi:4-diphosphocytidyl-2-C-methyl-D-erythritol kinase